MKFKEKWKKFWTLSRRNEGFTLVELIVVIAILGILAGVGTVAYSGYIKKAQTAADEILLDSLNTAFAAACIENGVDAAKVEAEDITISGGTVSKTDIVVTSPSAEKTDIQNAFDKYYTGGEFKVMTALKYDKTKGMFIDKNNSASGMTKVTYRGVELYLSQQDIDTFNASKLGSLGAEVLMTETAGVVGWAGEFGLADAAGENFYNAYYGYLGVDLSNYDLNDPAEAAEAQAAVDAAIERLGGDGDQIAANAIALYAAQNTAGVTTSAVSAWLNNGKTTDDIQNSATSSTLSEVSAIYGLYMSYKGEEFNNQNGNTLLVMGDALGDFGFAEWVEGTEGQKELEAYKSAMSMISDATEGDGVDSVLQYGFGDEQLITALQSVLGTN